MVHILVESNDIAEFDDFMQISSEPGIDVIHEKSFNGITNLIEIFIDAIPVIAVISPIIIEKIKKKNISKIKIDGDKIFILPPLNQLQKSDAQTHPSLQDIFYQKFQRLSTSFFNCSHAPGCSV